MGCIICDQHEIRDTFSNVTYKGKCKCGEKFILVLDGAIWLYDMIDENNYINHVLVSRTIRECDCGHESCYYGVLCTGIECEVFVKDIHANA